MKAFSKIDPEVLGMACQKAVFWDVKKNPYDIDFLMAGEDPFGSEVFLNLINCWNAKVYPVLRKEIKISEVPPIEELCLMFRMVPPFVLIFANY